MPPTPSRSLADLPGPTVAYSFCTMVTDLDEYHRMVEAFIEKGFTQSDCEYIYADNSQGNLFEPFSAYNRFLLEARGRFVILCHQDILPIEHGREHLDNLLARLTIDDPHWALAGNGGATDDGEYIYRITHGPQIELDQGGPYPREVMSLDENFIVIRRDANLALSRDLSGFHWYAADLCIIARLLGWRAYVVDFHLFHKSTGKITDDFTAKGNALRVKYQRAFQSRWHYVPTQRPVYLSSSPARTFAFRGVRRLYRMITWKLGIGSQL